MHEVAAELFAMPDILTRIIGLVTGNIIVSFAALYMVVIGIPLLVVRRMGK